MSSECFKPGGDSCGLTRSSVAIEALLASGVEVSPGYFDDWIHDVSVALGECASSCSRAGSCLASKLLTPSQELQETFPHPRHLEVVRI